MILRVPVSAFSGRVFLPSSLSIDLQYSSQLLHVNKWLTFLQSFQTFTNTHHHCNIVLHDFLSQRFISESSYARTLLPYPSFMSSPAVLDWPTSLTHPSKLPYTSFDTNLVSYLRYQILYPWCSLEKLQLLSTVNVNCLWQCFYSTKHHQVKLQGMFNILTTFSMWKVVGKASYRINA